MRFENTDDFKERLKAFTDIINQDPKETEPSQDGEYELVPIRVLEPDLQEVFNGAVDIIITSQSQMFDHVAMSINLCVFHPVYERFFTYSGTAAVQIQSEQPGEYKGSVKINPITALKVGIAACYSEAIKNAAKRIGPRFGRKLNKKPKFSAEKIATELLAKIPSEKNPRKPYGKRTKAEVTTAKKTIKNKVQMP